MQRLTSGISRRTFLRVGAGASAAVMLNACGGGGGPAAPGEQQGEAVESSEYTGPAVTMEFWNGFTGGDGPYLRDIVQQFNSEHDNINVKMVVREWAQFYEAVPAAVTSGRGPDVAIMHLDQLATNAARGVITPLDDVTEVLDLSEENFTPEIWEAGVYQDQRYGIPLDIHPLGFYYNKTLMERAGLDPESPPQTRQEYEDALEAMKGEGIQGHWVPPFLFTGGLSFQSLIPQFGGSMYDEQGMPTWNSEAGVQAAEWLKGLIEQGYSPNNVAQDAEHVAFQNDRNAFIWNGIWQINAYKEVDGLEWGVAPIPQIGEEQAAWASSHNFVIPNKSGQDENVRQAATTFISWISQNSLEWAKAGQVPARAQVRESPEFQQLEEQAVFASELPFVHFLPPVPGIGDANAEFETGFNEAISGAKSVQAALDDSAQQATNIMEENATRYSG